MPDSGFHRDGFFVIEKPIFLTCPECDKIYLEGVAVILFSIAGKRFFIGQGEDEAHQCGHCEKEIRGGFRKATSLVAPFPTMEAALERAVKLLDLLETDHLSFQKTVVLVETSAMEPISYPSENNPGVKH